MTHTRYGLTPPPSAQIASYANSFEGKLSFRRFCAYNTDGEQLANVLAGWHPEAVDVDDLADWVATRPLPHAVHAHLFEFFGDQWMMTEEYGYHDAAIADAERVLARAGAR